MIPAALYGARFRLQIVWKFVWDKKLIRRKLLTHSGLKLIFSGKRGYCDYYWTPTGGSTWSAVGWYGALLSANADNGARAGFGYLTAYYRSSYAHAAFGFRLCRF